MGLRAPQTGRGATRQGRMNERQSVFTALALRRSLPPFSARLIRIAFAAVSGFLLYLSFAPRPWWWLAPLAFAGLGLVLHGRRFRSGAALGFVFGLASFLPLLTWLQDFLGADFGPWPWLGLAVTLSGYLALAGGVLTLVQRLPGAPVWMAAVVIATEWARAWFPLGGFPWGRVAFTQPEGAFLPLAAVGGSPLVGLAVAGTGFGLARLLVQRPGGQLSTACRVLATAAPVVAGLALWPAIGVDPQSGSRTVAVVQGGAPDSGLGLLNQRGVLAANQFAAVERLAQAVETGRVARPDLLIWPESAVDLPTDWAETDRLIRKAGVPALVGALERGVDGRLRNVVLSWDPQDGPRAAYVKQRLVPFGEYIPARGLARLVTPFADAAGDLEPGSGKPAALSVAGTTVGTAICYEIAYDEPARDAVRAGAQLLTVPTNNAWYGRSEMTYQQLAMARLRAVEHGRAVLVAATSGVSAVVRPDGSVVSTTGMFAPGLLVEQVPLRTEQTLADRLGSLPVYLLTAGAVAAAVAGALLRRGRRG